MTTNSPRSRQKAFRGKSSGDDDWQEDYSASNNNSHGAMMMMASTTLQSPRNNNRDENAPDEITVPTYSHRRGNNESSGRHLYDDSVPLDQYRDPTMTSGSHSSSMTNPNSPHSPLHNISFTLPSYHDDSDSPPLDSIPLLPPRHGLLERRRSSRNHLDHAANSSGNNLAKTISSSSFLVMTTDYSSSGDEAALDATTLASQRRRHSRKWRQRKSLGAAAAPASNGSSTRRQLRQRSQSTLQQQQQSSSMAPWPCRLLCGNSKSSGRRNSVMWLLLVVVGGLSISLTIATNTRIREQQRETILLLQQKVPGDMASSQSSLRGNLLWQELERIGTGVATTTTTTTSTTPDDLSWAERYLPDSLFSWEKKKKNSTGNTKKKTKSKNKSKLVSAMTTATTTIQQAAASDTWGMSGIVLPAIDVPEMQLHKERSSNYDVNDRKLYRAASSSAATPTTLTRNRGESTTSHRRRTVILHESMMIPTTGSINAYNKKHLTLYPPDFTDNTQLYGILDSSDERVKTMERRPPLVDGECVPMQEWQTTFYPSCNSMHEVDMSGQRPETDLHLFGTKGYWRNAWRVDDHTPEQHDTLVLKTLKIEHRFEEAHFEHDRIDAVAMERLTSSPHVINIFSFCGHSVMTEHADGNRLGELADKSKKTPLARLRIARDIASGLADVHGIDGDGNATFVHLDINPANVISIDGTLKLNDFNIGIIRKWNTTSNQPCGFPAQYPNPQWRSPEEARNEQNLTEKVDIFSMGHIFFRLICGHEPWHKLEPGGKPTKQEMNEKVQKGILPTIPDFVKTSTSPEVVAIREAMLRCYEYDPSHRPSARQIAASLQTALDKLESKEAA